MDANEVIALVTSEDVLQALRSWVRTERQQLRWTQAELSRRSGVPSATISRFELTGLASTDALMKILFALNRLDALMDFLKGRIRLAELPTTLLEAQRTRPVLRVRLRKGER